MRIRNSYNGGHCDAVDDTIDYSFVVTNTGNHTLTDVVVTEQLVAVIGGTIVLTPSQVDSTTFTATYSITQTDIDAGLVDNTAPVPGSDPAVNALTCDSTAVSPVLAQCSEI